MKNKSVVLGIAAGFLLALPAIVAAQETLPIAAGRAPFDSPSFLGGSGRTVPIGSLEIVHAEGGASITLANGMSAPLAGLVGTLLAPEQGAVISGCCEVIAPGGVSFHVPEGSKAAVRPGAEGGIGLEATSGALFARNAELTLFVSQGGSVGASGHGKFMGIAGEGRVSRQDRWVTWKSAGAVKTLGPAELKRYGYKDCGDDEDPVSPSGPGGKKRRGDDDSHDGGE